jgi:glutathione S-transferase
MKLLNSFGPNPRMVRMFLLEKNITLPFENVDIIAGESRKSPYLEKNPVGQTPSLQLDDGRVIAETVVICEYLEEQHPAPALIGTNALERAEARMALRRMELNATEYLYNGFRFGAGLELFKDRVRCQPCTEAGLELFKDRVRCLPDAAEGLNAKGADGLKLADSLLKGQTFLCGNRLTIGDLVLYCCVDFCASAGFKVSPDLTNLHAWLERMNGRPSATASLSSNWSEIGLRG